MKNYQKLYYQHYYAQKPNGEYVAVRRRECFAPPEEPTAENPFRQRWFEDYRVGEIAEFGDHLVTEAEIVEFATRYDPQPFHVDAQAAKQSIYGGLISSVVLIVFSPAISGAKSSMLGESVNFAWFPLDNPAIVSIPIGFFLGYLGSVMNPDGDKFGDEAAEMEVRSMTGAGAAGALDH